MDHIPLDKLAVWRHLSTLPTKARVLIIHGISEHSGRHQNTIDFLNANQIEVIRFDLRGSGKSGGRKQYIDSFNDYVTDTVNVYHWICRELPPLPLFILGHSLGGAIACYFTAQHHKSLQGLMLSAPAFKVGGAISEWKIKAGQWLATVTPKLRIPKGGDNNAISRDPQVVKAYDKDPLAYHFNTVKQGDEVLCALRKMPSIVKAIPCPIWIAHGTHDQIILMQGSFELLKSFSSRDKTMFIIPGGYHEPHNDFDKESYFTAMGQWISNHLAFNRSLIKTQRP